MAGGLQRLYRGETTVDFFGRKRYGLMFSAVLIVVTVGSLVLQGLNLGIDFRGGVAWDAPRTGSLTVESAAKVLDDAGIDEGHSKIQVLASQGEERLRIQTGDQPAETRTKVQAGLAAKAGTDADSVSVATVSSTWGRSITNKAIRALVVFMLLVVLFIRWRFEWMMAVAAIAAMLHDVAVSVGAYSLLGMEVTPATVVAFLTILGFSLYDTIVVFDRVHENAGRFSGTRVSYGDVINVSMNQVLMRSLNTSIAAVLPVVSLLVVGSGILGAVALREFALALLVGLVTGAYSSIYIAAPILGILKNRAPAYAPLAGRVARGEDLAHLMATGAPTTRRGTHTPAVAPAAAAEAVLTHPPRPRKRVRR